MDSQNGSQGGQRYCPTPIMAPPSSSPAPPMQHVQHVPQPSLSPSPHLHPGYYSHSGGGYPPPQSQQQQSYYQNYSYQSHGHGQPPATQAPHYSHQQQQHQHQQWGHHSYYQAQQSVEVGSSQQQQQSPYQTEAYPHPPQAQSPYPPYVQHQHQQQRMHPVLPPPPPQQQQQPQHALMNLSRFVSQQSPPSPVPSMPHSPTTPVPIPMGSPHYHQQQPAIQGHLTPQPQSIYPQSQTPQGHMSLPLPNQSNLQHSPSPYHSPTIPIHSQNSKNSETQRIQQPIMPAVMSNTSNSTPNNHPNQTNAIMTSSSEQVQNPTIDNSINSVNHHMMSFSNGGCGRSESTSPSSSVSSSRALLSPPPTPNPPVVSSTSSNGHMIPVRLQNMQSGARTKASMRKMMQMQEQQISTVGGVGSSGSMGSGTEDSNNPTFSDPESTSGKKSTSSKKTPKKSKKGAPINNDNDILPETIKAVADADPVSEDESEGPMNDNFPTIAAVSARVSQTRKGGRKGGRSPKATKVASTKESLTKKSTPTPKRGRHRSSMSSNPENQELTLETQLSSTPRAAVKTSVRNLDKKKSPPEVLSSQEDDQEEHQNPTQKTKTARGKSTIGKKKPSLSPYSKAKGRKIVAKKNQKKSASKVDVEIKPESPDFPDALLLQLEAEDNAIPTRPIRMRAAKEHAKKSEEIKTEDRSRSITSRSKRGSVSYKEMSTSRSKSPKEIISPQLRLDHVSIPTKKSPSPSPAKRLTASPKEKMKILKVKLAKTSPRSPRKIKDASPSSARSSLLKEKSPPSRRESSRASKESVIEEEIMETPKRAPRKAKEKPAIPESSPELDVKTPPSPKKITNKKSKRDTTPVRMSSPRLAKEKSTTPGSPSKSNSLDLSEEQAEQDPLKPGISKRKAKSTAKAKTPKKGKILVSPSAPVIPTGKKRKIAKSAANNDVVVANDEPSEPTKKKAKVIKKRGGARQRAKARTPKSKSSCGKKETLIKPEEGESEVHLGSNDTSHADTTLGSDTTVGSLDGNNLSLSSQSQEVEMVSNFESVSASTSKAADITAAVSVTIGDQAVPRRRSKSSRQSIDASPMVSNSGTKAPGSGSLTDELNHCLIPLPPKDKCGQPMDPDDLLSTISPPTASNLQLLSDSVNSIMSSASVTSGKVSKPRKPRIPKAKKLTATPTSGSDIMNQSSILEELPHTDTPTCDKPKIETKKKKKQTKHELKQLEFQQRKAYLEVEVAQVLLDMKHNSSNSSSPSKVADVALAPTTSAQIQQNSVSEGNSTVSLKKLAKPRKSPVKPRKRKSTSDTPEIKIEQSGEGERPSTPLTNPIPPTSSTLSPDIATPLTKTKKGIKQPRRPKKPRLDIPGNPPFTSTPTILAVPQINGNQSLNFHPNNTISFQNTPKQSGPVKVSKTVMLGMNEPQTSAIAGIESTITSVSSGFITPSVAPSEMTVSSQKPKAKPRPRKKNVVTKILSVTSDPSVAGGDLTSTTMVAPKPKPKRPRPRKKPITLSPNLGLGNSDSITLQNDTAPSNSTPQVIANNIISSTVLPANSTPLGGTPIKKKRVYKNRRSLFKFSSAPKPLPVPTVFVKSQALQHFNGPTPSTSTSEKDKDKAPSLKVLEGKAVFYRGEKEELDVEPLMSKPRGPIQFDPEIPWLCCFCNLGPHAQKLGDLFGPYYTEQTKGSGKSKTTTKVETWMHQDCALWAGSVVLIGSKLHGLEDTLSHSTKDSCTTCGNTGATIGCLKRGCKQAVHFPCAVRKSWKLDQETFHSFCPAHIP